MFTPNTPQPHHRPHPLAVAASLLLTLAAPLAQAAYTVNADGTVTDSTTGLVWDRCVLSRSTSATACDTGSAATYSWANALAQVVARNTASHLGFADWRLPNVNELESLVSLERVSPAIDTTAFPNTPTNNGTPHATSTTIAATPAAAWGVEFGYGDVRQVVGAKTGSTLSYVRLVRSGPTAAAFDALPPANGTCGSAHATTPLVTTAPSGGALCTTGTASGVTPGNTAYIWTCAGGNGGSTPSCSASRGYTVTPSAGANGTISPSTPQVVTYNATPAFTLSANGGYAINTASGCGGALSGGTYTTGAVTADCTVTASFASVAPPPPPPPDPPAPPPPHQW